LDGARNEDTLPRWINYYWKAQELGLTNESDPYTLDRPLMRYEMALLLYRARNYDAPQIATHEPEIVKVDELIKT